MCVWRRNAIATCSCSARPSCRLVELSSPAGADLYHSYCARERRTYAEVLLEFASVRLPLAYLLELVPPLLPRQFSIASAPLEAVPVGAVPVVRADAMVATAPTSVVARAAAATTASAQLLRATTRLELCVGVVEYKTKYGRKKRGVCSAWAASLTPGVSRGSRRARARGQRTHRAPAVRRQAERHRPLPVLPRCRRPCTCTCARGRSRPRWTRTPLAR